jgi:hypothetical protein
MGFTRFRPRTGGHLWAIKRFQTLATRSVALLAVFQLKARQKRYSAKSAVGLLELRKIPRVRILAGEARRAAAPVAYPDPRGEPDLRKEIAAYLASWASGWRSASLASS